MCIRDRLQAIFAPESLEKKRNTEAVETAPSQLASARVVAYQPARTRPLPEVREAVRAKLVTQRSAELAREAGTQQLKAWKEGAVSSSMPPAVTVSREAAQGLALPVLTAALSAPVQTLPAWAGVTLGDDGYAVVRVDKVLPRAARDAQASAQEVQQYGQWWSSAEGQAYYDTLKARFKVKIKVPQPKS